MDIEALKRVQQAVEAIKTPFIKSLHEFKNVPKDFRPWTCGLSPSALYNCSLACRKRMGFKTPEVKWMSIKRWVTTTPEGVVLPPGVFLSIKRKEEFIPLPKPHFVKTEFVLLMFPYGNVWSQKAPDVPIDEEWIWSTESDQKRTVFESLMMKDAANPIEGYFESCNEYMLNNPDQIGIHLKRKRKSEGSNGES
jgi:hypothetical protein